MWIAFTLGTLKTSPGDRISKCCPFPPQPKGSLSLDKMLTGENDYFIISGYAGETLAYVKKELAAYRNYTGALYLWKWIAMGDEAPEDHPNYKGPERTRLVMNPLYSKPLPLP